MTGQPLEKLQTINSVPLSRIGLRRFRPADAQAVLAFGSDPQTLKWLVWEGIETLAQAQETIAGYYASRPGIYCIALKDTDECIGCIDLRLDEAHEKASFGYMLSRKHWGKGYMTETLLGLLGIAFDDLQLMRVESTHYEGNEASGRVMQKCGMRFEGKGVKEVKIKGVFHNVLHYAILKEDWLNRRSS